MALTPPQAPDSESAAFWSRLSVKNDFSRFSAVPMEIPLVMLTERASSERHLPRSHAAWTLTDEATPLWFHVVGGGARVAWSTLDMGPGMAGTRPAVSCFTAGLQGAESWLAGGEKGAPGAFGRRDTL